MSENRKKVLIVGDAGVGKTNLIKILSNDEFNEIYIPTKIIKKYETDKLILYDYPGEIKYNVRLELEIDIIIIVYDTTNNLSYKSLKFWKNKGEEYYKNIPIIIVGNKIDSNYRKIYCENSLNISVKNNININVLQNKIN